MVIKESSPSEPSGQDPLPQYLMELVTSGLKYLETTSKDAKYPMKPGQEEPWGLLALMSYMAGALDMSKEAGRRPDIVRQFRRMKGQTCLLDDSPELDEPVVMIEFMTTDNERFISEDILQRIKKCLSTS